jgi:hypothetical protein
MRWSQGRDRAPRGADECVDAVSERDAEARGTVAVEGRKLCAEIAHQEGRTRSLSVAIGIW